MNGLKIRVEYVILGIIIVSLMAYLVFRNPDRVHYQLPDMKSVPEDEITKIEIIKPDKAITMEKVDNQWVIQPGGYPVEPDKIKKIITDITNLTVTDVISESKNYVKYGLDEENRIIAKVYDKKGYRYEFEIGKQAATYHHTYVKLEKDSRVFHARDSFRSHFNETVDSLRNKLVMKFDQDEIREIQLINGEDTLVFTKTMEKVEIKTDNSGKEEIWLLPDGKKGKKEELKTILRELSPLRCLKFIEDKTGDDFKNPLYRIILKGNKNYTLQIFKKLKDDDDSYPAVTSESPYIFSIASLQADRLMKKPEDVIETSKQK
ncbi:MAG: DUF4340 domain-containing protein [Candidatus Aminicenantes bacterium]|nr:DUF4340 domain-containing protein [Candidatus Aminicenantes bacterium]